MEVFKLYYEVEIMDGLKRKKVELIPSKTFIETNANIKVNMFKDRIEISSPGGLPSDLSEEDYWDGGLSIL